MNSSRLTQFLYLAGILLQILFIWSLPLYLTQDGPSHLINAQLFTDLLNGEGAGLFEINSAIYPNWTGTVLLGLLLKVFPPVFAEKLWVTVLMLLFIHSGYTVIRQIQPKNAFLALIIIFLGQNFFFVYGFHNFILSIALFNWVVLNYLKNANGRSSGYFLKQTFLLLLLFFTHPVAFLLALVYLGTSVLAEEILGDTPGINWTNIGFQLATLAPSLLFFLAYFVQMEPSGGAPVFVFNLSPMAVVRLAALTYMDVFEGLEKYIFAMVGVLMFGQLVLSARSIFTIEYIRKYAGIIAVWICCTIIYFFINDVIAGGSFFARRTTLIFYIVTLFLLAPTKLYWRFSHFLGIFLFLLFCVQLVYRYPKHRQVASIAKQYTEAAGYIPAGSVILPLQYSKKGIYEGRNLSPAVSVFSHISGYIALMSESTTLDNYEANTSYFPVRWREGKNPYEFIEFTDAKDQWNFNLLNLPAYHESSGVNPDYFILFGKTEGASTGLINEILKKEEVFSNDVVRVFR